MAAFLLRYARACRPYYSVHCTHVTSPIATLFRMKVIMHAVFLVNPYLQQAFCLKVFGLCESMLEAALLTPVHICCQEKCVHRLPELFFLWGRKVLRSQPKAPFYCSSLTVHRLIGLSSYLLQWWLLLVILVMDYQDYSHQYRSVCSRCYSLPCKVISNIYIY